MELERAISQAVGGAGVEQTRSLSGGCIHDVYAVALDDGRRVVAKINRPSVAYPSSFIRSAMYSSPSRNGTKPGGEPSASYNGTSTMEPTERFVDASG